MSRIVDAHIHLFQTGCLPEKWYSVGKERWAASKWPHPSPDRVDIESGLVDDDASLLAETVPQTGVDSVIALGLDWGVSLGEPAVPTTKIHAWYGELQQQHRGVFYGVAGVDPRRSDAVAILREALEVHGLRGLKLYPPTGFRASDPMCDPLYELCLEFDVPVVLHTAYVGYPHNGRYANPLHINDIQCRFPNLKIVLAHGGYPFWFLEAMDVVAHHPTTYFEMSNWNFRAATAPDEVNEKMLEVLRTVGAHRMIFASDHLGGRRFSGAKQGVTRWLDQVRALPAFAAEHGAEITPGEMDLILGENAVRVFGLD